MKLDSSSLTITLLREKSCWISKRISFVKILKAHFEIFVPENKSYDPLTGFYIHFQKSKYQNLDDRNSQNFTKLVIDCWRWILCPGIHSLRNTVSILLGKPKKKLGQKFIHSVPDRWSILGPPKNWPYRRNSGPILDIWSIFSIFREIGTTHKLTI